MVRLLVCLVVASVACATAPARSTSSPELLALPGAPPNGVGLDVIAFDEAHQRLWVPAGSTASVDVVDLPGGKLHRLGGFATTAVRFRSRERTVGPSSVAVAGATVYVGNRGDSGVCAFDAASLAKKECVSLDASPDLLADVPSAQQLWVTTPRDKSIRILDTARGLATVARLVLDGEPEGVAVDDARGLFFTNLEDRDRTLAIDVRTRRVVQTWSPGCGEDGPKGLAFDAADDVLIVACPDHVLALDARDGTRLSTLAVGPGVDLVDYVEKARALYVAAGRAAKLVVAHVDPHGRLSVARTVATRAGARNAVAGAGRVFLVAPADGAVLVVRP